MANEELAARLRAGDRTAYASEVSRHRVMVMNLIFRMVGDASVAEELAQETFINAFVALPTFQGKSKFSTWLCRIALNKSKDYLKSARVRNERLEDQLDEGAPLPDDRVRDPEARLLNKELGASLERALSRLKVKYRELFLLKHVEGLSYEEIGEIVDLPLHTLKIRVFRARERLAELLEEEERRK